MEIVLEPIKSFEPETSFNQMDYLREYLMQDKKKTDFATFVKKLRKI